MSKNEIKGAIFEFLELIERGKESVEANEAELVLALDKLALVYHFSKFPFDEKEYTEPPKKDYNKVRAMVVERFPNYGYYNVPCDVTTKIAQTGIIVGDAIDDITDIALDMQEIRWRWGNTSELDALWDFRFGSSMHWIDHMRNLQFYLNAYDYEE